MSLIITYTSSKGCVIIGDKRKIAYLGSPQKRKELEKELYDGNIKTEEELRAKAEELGIRLNIRDDARKVRSIGDVVVGEVSLKTPFEAKRRRIYATTGAYQIIELIGSNITKFEKGESSIVIFGNTITKKLASRLLKKHWKKKTSLKEVSKLLAKILEEVAARTPTISPEYDMYIKTPRLDKRKAHRLLRETILRDVKTLQKWRAKLQKELLKKSEQIKMASKIITEGEIGRVINVDNDKIEVKLAPNVQAFNIKWKKVAKPGENVLMLKEKPGEVKVGDLVIIENENLQIKDKKIPLQCNVILCKI
ncbi:MAG: DUF2121 domain-containing protein [Methanothermobacter sp.]|nr:DUF2121 domain-containing protein [Methanothermobacter sp.]